MTAAAAPRGFDPELPIERISECASNHRGLFDPALLAELTESIRQKGVLQPVLVRPSGDRFELVFGHRRLRAAKAAGLRVIPATIRELDDLAVLEAQLIENCNRADVHPLEEAEGYTTLHRQHQLSAEEIAAKVGKSKAYVYARMKLAGLPAVARKAFLDGKLTAATALLIARIPDRKLAEKATKDLIGAREPLSFQAASRHVQQNYMLRLDDAPFPKADASLYAAAGACGPCPKRTGNARDLFGDVSDKDICTDPPCYRIKLDRHWKILADQAERAGQRVIPAGESGRVFTKWGGITEAYRKLDDHYYLPSGNDITYRQLVNRAKGEDGLTVLARDPNDGMPQALFVVSELPRALAAAGIKAQSKHPVNPDDAKRKREQRILAETGRRALAAAIEAYRKPRADGRVTQELFALMVVSLSEEVQEADIKALLARHKVLIPRKAGQWGHERKALRLWIRTLSTEDLACLHFELAFCARAIARWQSPERESAWVQACTLLGVDLAAIRKQVQKDLAPKRAAKKPQQQAKRAPSRKSRDEED